MARMRTVTGMVDVDTASAQHKPKLQILIDRRKAADLGVRANDIAGSLGGFYTELNYGVLFPMAGLGYTDRVAAAQNPPETRIAQTLRWYLGVML